MKTAFDPDSLRSEAERTAFFEGYQYAGGYVGDTDTDCPWGAPWTWATSIPQVAGPALDVPAEFAAPRLKRAFLAGARFWPAVAAEVGALLEEERRAVLEDID